MESKQGKRGGMVCKHAEEVLSDENRPSAHDRAIRYEKEAVNERTVITKKRRKRKHARELLAG